jgi:hypothetical protein
LISPDTDAFAKQFRYNLLYFRFVYLIPVAGLLMLFASPAIELLGSVFLSPGFLAFCFTKIALHKNQIIYNINSKKAPGWEHQLLNNLLNMDKKQQGTDYSSL